MKKDIFDRLKSPVTWAAILAQVLVIIGLYLPNLTEPIKITGTAVIEIATVMGVLNNPTDRKNF